jgi:hypothetical protein
MLNFLEINIIKIGKLAAPAVAVIAGAALALAGFFLLGVTIIVAGICAYLAVWWWTIQSSIKLAREGTRRERLKLAREKEHKERISAQTLDRANKAQHEEESLKRKWGDRLAKKFWDSL